MTATTQPPLVVEIRDLVKTYAGVRVLDGVSFSVRRGEVFGFLGPNGAGKTTTLEIVEGLREASSGTVRVLGLDLGKNLREIRQRIGVSLQSTRYWGLLTVRETIRLFQDLYAKHLSLATLSAAFDLERELDVQLKSLSGGTYQRVVLALALVNDPELILLDEPTIGLDPQARRRLWQTILDLRDRGKTVILTTHYMEEAEALCGRVAIIDHGKIIQTGTPQALIESLAAEVAISFSSPGEVDLAGLAEVPWCSSARRIERGRFIAYCADLKAGIDGLTAWAVARGLELRNVETRGATLDDVFLHYAAAGRVEP
jgi:ABC-2 type transport system ATP-binding protein